MNRSRAFTLIEMLVTLTLLTVMLVIAVTWMTTVLRSQTDSQNDSNWMRASLSLLDRIAEDLHTLDRLDDGRRSAPARVDIDDSVLRIRTRDGGGIVTHEYILSSGDVRCRVPGSRVSLDEVPMVGDVESFECVLELPEDRRLLPLLLVSIQRTDGLKTARSYTLDREDVQ